MAGPLQDRISAFNNNELIPALTEVCDQLVEPSQRIRIDRLEIDLGKIQMDKLESEFKDSIVKEFKSQLQRMVIKNPSLVETVIKTQEPDSSIIHKTESVELNKIDLFIYFLAHGFIPWWYPRSEFKMEQVIDSLLLNSPKLLLKKIIPLLESKNIRLRLAEILSDKQFIHLIDRENKLELNLIWNELLRQFQKKFFEPLSLNKVKLIIFETVLLELTFLESIQQRKKKLKTAFLKAIIILQPTRAREIVNYKKQRVNKLEGNVLLSKLVENLSPLELKEILKELAPKSIKTTDSVVVQPMQEEMPSKQQQALADKFVEINNAGIVLLWPYLQLFFKELKLIEDKTFIDEESNWKAVHLLHFLAFGNEVAEEHEWALNKILCGLRISDFVPTEFSLSKAEKAECNNLLQSVVRNWKVLKNTSVQGLQKSFLTRNGLIKNDQNGFIVEIERITIDVLLDKLNWTLSVISLPWNKGLIHVRW